MKCKSALFFIFLLFFIISSYSQEIDSALSDKPTLQTTATPAKSAKVQKHNPKLAIALSVVVPGAGQIYNKKWWKVPIIYAGLGITSYLIYDFSVQTKRYQNEYVYRLNKEVDKLNPKYAIYTDENVLALKNYYRRNMEISIAACAIIYFLNVIDAAVDAHLFYFDISDDLALSWSPYIGSNSFTPSLQQGVSLAIHFKK